MLAGTDAGTGVRGHVGGQGGRGGTHTHTHTQQHTHTGTYTRMLHLPFSDLPLKKCPTDALVPGGLKARHLKGDICKSGLTLNVTQEVNFQCLVGACVTTGDRIFATGSDTVSKYHFIYVFAILCSFQGLQSWFESAPEAQNILRL